jgi:carbonic anhydrase/acetyltransferase-like protein (isoleucine patch superfamily)
MGHEDRIVPSLRCIPISDGKYPRLLDADWVAPNATMIGDIEACEGASIWHGVTIRGDTLKVNIGKNSIIEDLTHISSRQREAGDKIEIGDNVHVGANATLDACTLENFSYIGMGATVGRNAKVESYGVVAAGAVVGDNITVPAGQVWAGSPAQYLRDLTQEEKHYMNEHNVEM